MNVGFINNKYYKLLKWSNLHRRVFEVNKRVWLSIRNKLLKPALMGPETRWAQNEALWNSCFNTCPIRDFPFRRLFWYLPVTKLFIAIVYTHKLPDIPIDLSLKTSRSCQTFCSSCQAGAVIKWWKHVVCSSVTDKQKNCRSKTWYICINWFQCTKMFQYIVKYQFSKETEIGNKETGR